MTQWEYKIEYKGINGTDYIVEYLNSMGADGWENYQERDRFYWFKRPIQQQQPSPAEKIVNEVKSDVEQEGKFGIDWYARPKNEG